MRNAEWGRRKIRDKGRKDVWEYGGKDKRRRGVEDTATAFTPTLPYIHTGSGAAFFGKGEE